MKARPRRKAAFVMTVSVSMMGLLGAGAQGCEKQGASSSSGECKPPECHMNPPPQPPQPSIGNPPEPVPTTTTTAKAAGPDAGSAPLAK